MYAVGRLSSYISQGVYTVSAPFHPFGGAVDIIVVQQQDGSFKSSPWYVKFGKFQGVLKTKEKVVSINVNGVETDFHMYLDHTGEAYFLKEVDIEECESSAFDPSSSREETDNQSLNKSNEKAKCQDFDVKQLSLNAQIDGSNGKIITRTNSRHSRMFGLFGRKSMKEDSRQREAVKDPVERVTSLEHAEIAADLLEVKWSTSLTTNGSTMDEVSTLSSINVAPKEVVMNLHVNEGTVVDSILVPDRINNSFDNSSLQKATAPCDAEMGKHCGSKLVDSEQSNGINSPKASCTSSKNLDKEISNLEASNLEEKFEVMPDISISKFDGGPSIQHNAEHESDGNVQFLSSGLHSGESGTFHILFETSKSSRVGFEVSDEQNHSSGNSSNGESEKPLVHDKVPIDKVEAGPKQAVLMVKEDSSNLRPLNDEHSCNSSCTKAICGSEGSSFGGETRSIVTESHCTYDIHLLTSACGGAEMLEIIQQETITEPLTDERTSETNSFEVHENESQVMGLSHCTSGVSREELEDRSSGPHPEVVNGNRMSHSVEVAELQGNCTSGSSQKELEESARSSGSNLDVVKDNRMLPSGEVVELQGNWMSSSSQEKRKEPARSSGSHLEVVSGNQIFHSVEEAKLQGDCTSDGHQEELEELAGSSGPHLGVVSGSRILHSVEKAKLQGDCNSGGRQEEIDESARRTGPHLEVVSGNQILHSVEEPELHGDCKSDGRQEVLEEPARISGHLEVVSSDQILHSVEEAELLGDCTLHGRQEELEEPGRSTGPHFEVVSGNRMLRPVEVAEKQGGGRSSVSQNKLEEPARSSGLHLEVVCGNRMLHPVEVAELQGDCMSSGSQEKLEEPGWSSGLHLEVVSGNQILHAVEEAELQGDCRSGGRLEELEESARSSGRNLEVVSGNQMFHSVEEEKLQGDCTSGGRQEELEESARGSGAHPELVRDNQILHSVKEAKIQGDCTFSSNSNTTSLVEEEENLGQENEMNKLHQSSAFIDDLQLSSTEHSPTKSTPSCIPLPKISWEDQFTFSDTDDFEPGAVHRADSGLSDCVDTDNYPLVTIGSSEESLGPNDVNHESYFSSVNNVQEPSLSSFEYPIEESRTTSSSISIPRIRKCGGAEVDWMTKSVPNFRFRDDDLEKSGIRHHLSHSLDSHYDTFKLELQKDGVSGSLMCDSDTEQQLIEDLNNDDIHAWEELKNMSTDSAVEISLCKHVLYEGMGAEAASLAFDAERVGLKKFVSLGPGILKNDKLIVRIGGQYLPWDAAAPIILGTLAFGHDQKLAPRGMIPVERVEKTVNVELTTTTASSSGSWRIWPFTFKRSGTLNSAQPAQDRTRDSTSVSTSKTISPVKENNTSNVTENSTSNVTEKNTEQKVKFTIKKVKSLVPSSEQLSTLNLKEGQNVITFTFSTAMLGKQQVDAKIYLWKWNTRIVISDVDGTITKSDVLGQFMPLVGKDWSQTGVAHLFSAIKENGYQLLFLSARSISQAYLTRQFLFNLKQDGKALPDGPVVISPDGLFPSLFREVIRRAPHEFKIACLKDIKDLFPPDCNPFYAGFGNRDTDEFSYLKVGIPRGKIFIINAKGEVSVNRRVDRKSYTSLHALVNGMFPAMSSAAAEQEEFNSWNYWKMPLPDISSR